MNSKHQLPLYHWRWMRMKNEKVLQDRTKMNYFSSIIKEENQRMNRQVETILKASQLEKQEVGSESAAPACS